MIPVFDDDAELKRLGKVTASRVADIVARTKSGYAASRANYLAQLVAERLTGLASDGYATSSMIWGVAHEDEAKAAYAFYQNFDVRPCGFVEHPRIANAGASPDGLIGEDGLAEFKCPNTYTHIETLLTKTIPAKYQHQMLWQMACTGRAWCDFVSYDPRLSADLCLYVERFVRDDNCITNLEDEVRTFLFEVETVLSRLRRGTSGPRPIPANIQLPREPEDEASRFDGHESGSAAAGLASASGRRLRDLLDASVTASRGSA
jgi:hypothetical protein